MLTGEEIRDRRIVAPDSNLPSDQVQPNGIDLSLDLVWRILGTAKLGVSNSDRRLPDREPIPFDERGWLTLEQGAYGIRFCESVVLPPDCGGLAFPRSSLLRMGAHIPTAVWDAGYGGRGESLLIVTNKDGVRLQRGARVAQLVVFGLTGHTTGYAGRYQAENL
jgi:dUTP pyrophosphatase